MVLNQVAFIVQQSQRRTVLQLRKIKDFLHQRFHRGFQNTVAQHEGPTLTLRTEWISILIAI